VFVVEMNLGPFFIFHFFETVFRFDLLLLLLLHLLLLLLLLLLLVLLLLVLVLVLSEIPASP